MEGTGSMCLDHMNSLTMRIKRPGDLFKDSKIAQSAVKNLVMEVKEAERQLASLADFLSRSELSARYRNDCEHSVHNLGIEINRLTNLIDNLKMKIHQRNPFLRAACRRHLLGGGYGNEVREEINRTCKKMSVIRQEIWLDISLNSREAKQEPVEVIQNRAPSTSASSIRQQYKRSALRIMVEEHLLYAAPRNVNHRHSENVSLEERRCSRVATVSIREVRVQGVESTSTQESNRSWLEVEATSADLESLGRQILEEIMNNHEG
ncbi:hypothetical protein Dda_3306 [Drechslerella dactyloides]|uniref:Uncharacterized protein n=1 Tax=Drechslerella dactyloides TaxID=74499 RepID=A0AAD6NK80_DREDA|nr:hypothetical protein Dda_3306 [Drechslerella dactyloides]